MTQTFRSPLPFTAKKKSSHITVIPLDDKSFKTYVKATKPYAKKQIETAGFEGKPRTALCILSDKGALESILLGINTPVQYFDGAYAVDLILKTLPTSKIGEYSFAFEPMGLAKDALDKLHIGWGWGCYSFNFYKENKSDKLPALIMAAGTNKARIQALIESVHALKNLINTPSNDCGPDELESYTKTLAKAHQAKVSVIKDEQLLTKNFPLIYMVGKASPRRPRLIDMKWGDESHPKLTLVGKGVCFDTGGLDIKPSSAMRFMKKDMGGAAHVLALAEMIMRLKLPVRLRVLIAAVENAIAGEAFRPGDICKSRKGIFVENTNTDAEGRLILADTLTYACEDAPELIIDYATLTGSARAALGPDIPGMFSNTLKIARDLQDVSFTVEDPVWNMPLWQDYKKHNKSAAADMVNSAGLPGDLIYSALFLESFLTTPPKAKSVPEWVHLDCFAWEQTGRPGRPSGAADTGMRAVLAYLENRYSVIKAKKK